MLPLSIASGSSDKEWPQRVEHGKINLYLNSKAVSAEDSGKVRPTEEAENVTEEEE